MNSPGLPRQAPSPSPAETSGATPRTHTTATGRGLGAKPPLESALSTARGAWSAGPSDAKNPPPPRLLSPSLRSPCRWGSPEGDVPSSGPHGGGSCEGAERGHGSGGGGVPPVRPGSEPGKAPASISHGDRETRHGTPTRLGRAPAQQERRAPLSCPALGLSSAVCGVLRGPTDPRAAAPVPEKLPLVTRQTGRCQACTPATRTTHPRRARMPGMSS